MLNKLFFLLFLFLNFHTLYADSSAKITNPSFEWKWVGWEKNRRATAISDICYLGEYSAKITRKQGEFYQRIKVKKNTNYQLSASILGKGILGVRAGKKNYKIVADTHNWTKQRVVFNSKNHNQIKIFGKYIRGDVRFDDFSLVQVDAPNKDTLSSKYSGFANKKQITKKYNSNKQKKYPSDIIPKLAQQWKLTLPIDKYGHDNSMTLNYYKRNTNPPIEIRGQNLKNYEYPPYFYAKNHEVFFRAYAAGVTTKHSHYPRCELRQNIGGCYSMWSLQDKQYLYTQLRITHLPKIKPEVTVVQIHGKNNETLRVNYKKNKGIYIYRDEKNGLTQGDKPLRYSLGEKLEITINVNKGIVSCLIKNISRKTEFKSTWRSVEPFGYFKVGCYTQSSIFLPYFKRGYEKGELPSAYAEVAVTKIVLKETF